MNENIVQIKGTKPVTFCLDTLAKAMYVAFSNNPVAKTVRKNMNLAVDYDKNGKLVGIEIIRLKHVSAVISKVLKDTEDILPSRYRKAVENLIPTGV